MTDRILCELAPSVILNACPGATITHSTENARGYASGIGETDMAAALLGFFDHAERYLVRHCGSRVPAALSTGSRDIPLRRYSKQSILGSRTVSLIYHPADSHVSEIPET